MSRGASGYPRVTVTPSAATSGKSTGFFSVEGHTYAVKGLPSIVTSTRLCDSSTATFTALSAAIATCRLLTASKDPSSRLRIHLASRENLLRLRVERHALPRLDRRHVHAQRHRVAVARIHMRIRLLARAHALHPVPHVRRGLLVRARVGRSRGRLRLAQRERPQLVRFHSHLGR